MEPLVTKITIDSSGFGEELKKAESQLSGFQKKVTGVGGIIGNFMTGGIGGVASGLFGSLGEKLGLGKIFDFFTESAAEFQAKVKDIKLGTLETGFDPATYQRLNTVLESSGSSMGALVAVMSHLSQAQSKIINGEDGAEKMLKLFQELGITLGEVQNMSPQDMVIRFMRAIREGNLESAEFMAAIKELGGRGAMQIVPASKRGLDSYASEGGIIGTDELQEELARQKMEAPGKAILKDVKETAGGVARGEGLFGLGPMTPIRGIAHGLANLLGLNPDDSETDQKMAELNASQGAKRAERQRAEREQLAKQIADKKEEEEQQKRAAKADTEAARMSEKTAELREGTRLSKLTPAQRIAELQEKLSGLNSVSTNNPLDAAKIDRQRADVEADIAKLQKTDQVHEKPTFDALANIGGLTSYGAFNEQLTLQRDMAQDISEMRDGIRSIDRAMAEGVL